MLTLVAILLALVVLPSPWGVVAVVGAALVDVLETVALVWWTRRRRPAVGVDDLVGRRAVAATGLHPTGQVLIQGERWSARSTSAVPTGGEVVVLGVDGLVLEVEPVDGQGLTDSATLVT